MKNDNPFGPAASFGQDDESYLTLGKPSQPSPGLNRNSVFLGPPKKQASQLPKDFVSTNIFCHILTFLS